MFESRFKMVALALVMVPTISLAEANDDVESRVRAYFTDAPIMIPIAECESEFRQFGVSGALLGGAGGAMIGVFQVHSDVHADFALSKGMDIYTLDGNLAYARYLYEREGTRPWLSSFPCWNKEIVNPERASTTVPRTDLGNTKSGSESALLSINLSMGMEHESVRALQKMLNGAGYTIADSGPGSIGNETIKFGVLTRAAVRKFQCEKIAVCDGDEYSTGYGFVGSRTRSTLAGVGSRYATPVLASESGANAAEIARLEAQIAELTKALAALLAAR